MSVIAGAAEGGKIGLVVGGPIGMVAGAVMGVAGGVVLTFLTGKGISALRHMGEAIIEDIQKTSSSNSRSSQNGGGDQDPPREPQREDEDESSASEDEGESSASEDEDECSASEDEDECSASEDEDESSASEDEDESSASEDENSEDSTETSEAETQLEATLNRIRDCPLDAPVSKRIRLYRKLVDALGDILNNPGHRVRINRWTRHLFIEVPGFRPIELEVSLRDTLSLFREVDLESHLNISHLREQPVIYRIQCRLCERGYVGLTRNVASRHAHHRSRVNAQARDTGPARHLNSHSQDGTVRTFDNTFQFLVVRDLPNNTLYRIVRNWEVFFQWLFKGRKGDGGLGKR